LYPNPRQSRRVLDSRAETCRVEFGLEACKHINSFFLIMATGPPNKVRSTSEAAASMLTDANEQVFMAGRRPCLIMMSTNADDSDFESQAAPGSRVVVHQPRNKNRS
jgi:hypothetical protein